MKKIFIIGDTHFNHKNIIHLENRPFRDVIEMNIVMEDNWNKVISNDDIVIFVGDFGFGNYNSLKPIMDSLNGEKYLIKGNHDNFSRKKLETFGYKKVFNRIEFDNVIISHKPQANLKEGLINIHGHVHSKSLPKEKGYINVSIEALPNYTPIELNKLISHNYDKIISVLNLL